MQTLLQAIAREEGFYAPGSRPSRNCNPGDLNFEPWEESFGAKLETPLGSEEARFACFPSVTEGFAAMRHLLLTEYAGLTLEAALNKWAPPSDGNDTSAYLASVSEWTGMSANTILTADLIG